MVLVPGCKFSLIGVLQKVFCAHGRNVANRPLAHIFFCACMAAVSSVGILYFQEESYGVRLWLSKESPFRFSRGSFLVTLVTHVV